MKENEIIKSGKNYIICIIIRQRCRILSNYYTGNYQFRACDFM